MAGDSSSNMETKSSLKTYRTEFQSIFSNVYDPFDYAITRDSVIQNKMFEANERVTAFPYVKAEHESLIRLIMQGQALWEECENRLRRIVTMHGVDVTSVATQINQSHAKADEYREMYSTALKNMLSNTSSLYKAGTSMKTAGQVIQGAGNAMQSAGHSMTIGCTIPIILLIILLMLFMIVL